MIGLSWLGPVHTSDDDMARRSQKLDPELSSQLVTTYVAKLKHAGRDRPAFQAVIALLEREKLATTELVSIALQYRGGGVKPTSKKAAMESIANRFLELVRDHIKEVQAAKARPW